jgi:O-methyltransferase involved in polyketide biosynthesis
VDWYDIDFPEVIAARHQLLPPHPNGHTIGADLTDPDWLDAGLGDHRPGTTMSR